MYIPSVSYLRRQVDYLLSIDSFPKVGLDFAYNQPLKGVYLNFRLFFTYPLVCSDAVGPVTDTWDRISMIGWKVKGQIQSQ